MGVGTLLNGVGVPLAEADSLLGGSPLQEDSHPLQPQLYQHLQTMKPPLSLSYEQYTTKDCPLWPLVLINS